MKSILHTHLSRKSFFTLLYSLLLCISLTLPAFAGTDLNSIVIDGEASISGDVWDGAGLLTSDEVSSLSAKLADLEDRYQCDVAVVTLNDTNGYDVRDYAKAIYLRCGYGYGSDKDGILFVASMAKRDWQLFTYGYGMTAITDYGVDYIGDHVVSKLSDGDYYDAFTTFADITDAFLKQAREGTPYDVDHPARLTLFSRILPYLMSFGIAFIIALIICCILAASMKTAARKHHAAQYLEPGSFQLTKKRDYYLYTTTQRVKHESNNSGSSSSGGSSTDSNGFGGGGGKF